MGKFSLKRRAFLRGVLAGAGATIALPPLEAMFNASGTTYANGDAIPRRFGVFFWGNGVLADRWVPGTTGNDWQLSDQLRPLANVKEYVSVVSGTEVKAENRRGHHSGAVGILSGAPFIEQDPGNASYASTFSRPSIDQVIADEVSNGTLYRSLEVGVDPRVSRSEGTTLQYLSHNGPDNVNPPEYDPAALFAKLFGDGFVEPGGVVQADPTLAVRRNILDAVREDAASLKKRLGQADRHRVDQHLEGISALQQRLQIIEDQTPPTASACVRPGDPGSIGNDNAQEQRRRSRAMADLLAMALACDQTRVWSNQFSGSVAGTNIHSVDSTSVHSLTHDEPGNQPKVHQCVVFIMEELNYLLETMRNTPEGDGNLLDHSVIMATTDLSSGRRHNNDNYPILVCGKGGGTLKGNYHHAARGNPNSSQVLLSLVRAMGIERSSFGHERGYTDSWISEIMT